MLKHIWEKHCYYLMSRPLRPGDCVAHQDTAISFFDSSANYPEDILGNDISDIRRLAQLGDRVFFFLENENITGLSMGHVGPCFVKGPGILVDIGHEDVYIYWVVVDKKSRGMSISSKLFDSYVAYYSRLGIKRMYYLVDCGNLKMINISLRKGFGLDKRITTYKIFGKLVVNSCGEPAPVKCQIYLVSSWANLHTI